MNLGSDRLANCHSLVLKYLAMRLRSKYEELNSTIMISFWNMASVRSETQLARKTLYVIDYI